MPVEEQNAGLDAWGQQYQLTDDNKEAIRHARFFVEGVHPGLYVWGGVGTGKTALACATLNELHRKGNRVRFVQVSDLLKQLVQQGTGDEVCERAIEVPVLCLDDLGAQKASDYARQMLLLIADGRHHRGHRTIWTSNLSLDQLQEFLDDQRLASRLAGTAQIVQMDGEDYRLKKARARKRAAVEGTR